MRGAVSIQQSPDHLLILCVSFLRLTLKEVHAGPAQGDRHLYRIIPKGKLIRRGKKIRHDFDLADGFIGVFDFLVHADDMTPNEPVEKVRKSCFFQT